MNFTKKILAAILLVLLIITAIALFNTNRVSADNTSPYSLAPQQPNFYREETTAFPLLLTNNQSITFTGGSTNSQIFYIRQDHGLSLFLQTVQTNSVVSTTTNVIIKMDVSFDGTNFTTGQPVTWTQSYIGGASTNLYWTNYPATFINNIRALQVTVASTTASNNVRLRLWQSFSGQ